MLDRYVELSITTDPTLAKLPPSDLAMVRELKRELKRVEPSYRKVYLHCETRITVAAYDCAMEAKTPAAWESCVP
jgi:hypothetical protein